MSNYLAAAGGGGGFQALQSLQNAFTTFVSYLPQIIGALVVLVIGYIIAKLIKMGVSKLLQKVKLDERLTSRQGGSYVQKLSPKGSPSRLVGLVIFWVIMLFVISSAIGTLGIPALTGFMNVVLGYLPNIVAALLILLVASAIAGAIAGFAHRTMGDTPTGKVVRAAGPGLVMAIAMFMILTQLHIAPTIVVITYAALVFAAALAAALAFGLGGREAAAQMVNSGYRKAQEQGDTVRHDAAVARERGQRDAEHARQRAQESASDQSQGQDSTGSSSEDSSGATRRFS